MSAHVNSDGGGERIVSSKEDWSISSPGEDGDHHRPDGENDAKCYENAVVCDEARRNESDGRRLAKLEPLAERFPASHWFFAEKLQHADFFSCPPCGGIKGQADNKSEESTWN